MSIYALDPPRAREAAITSVGKGNTGGSDLEVGLSQ
jgi:hypothetical protein